MSDERTDRTIAQAVADLDELAAEIDALKGLVHRLKLVAQERAERIVALEAKIAHQDRLLDEVGR